MLARVPWLEAATVDTFVGLLSVGLGMGHLIGVIGVAIRRTAVTTEPFVYDFHFAALILVGVVVVVSGGLCLASARRLGCPLIPPLRRVDWELPVVADKIRLRVDDCPDRNGSVVPGQPLRHVWIDELEVLGPAGR